jgi:hypothetical protein
MKRKGKTLRNWRRKSQTGPLTGGNLAAASIQSSPLPMGVLALTFPVTGDTSRNGKEGFQTTTPFISPNRKNFPDPGIGEAGWALERLGRYSTRRRLVGKAVVLKANLRQDSKTRLKAEVACSGPSHDRTRINSAQLHSICHLTPAALA